MFSFRVSVVSKMTDEEKRKYVDFISTDEGFAYAIQYLDRVYEAEVEELRERKAAQQAARQKQYNELLEQLREANESYDRHLKELMK